MFFFSLCLCLRLFIIFFYSLFVFLPPLFREELGSLLAKKKMYNLLLMFNKFQYRLANHESIIYIKPNKKLKNHFNCEINLFL